MASSTEDTLAGPPLQLEASASLDATLPSATYPVARSTIKAEPGAIIGRYVMRARAATRPRETAGPPRCRPRCCSTAA